MAKVVLFNPQPRGIFGAAMPSLSLLAISANLKKNGIQTVVINGVKDNVEQIVGEEIKDAVYFGISCMTGPQITYALRMAAFVKDLRADLPIVWGGYHPTLMPEQTIDSPLVDIIVKGMGEDAAVELALVLQGKGDLDAVRGIVYKRPGGTHVTTAPRPMADINNFPMLDYAGIPAEEWRQGGTIPYMSSRGCPHHCSYCVAGTVYGRKWNHYSEDRVLQELEYITKEFCPGIKSIMFWDDNFFVDKHRVERLCRGFIQRKFNFKWGGFCRCDYLPRYDKETLLLIKEAGLSWISFGGESGSDALFRRPMIAELRDRSQEDPRESTAGDHGLSYVGLDGDIGCIINGAGLAMATMDMIHLAGGEPANFLDIGGGASPERVVRAFRTVLADGKVSVILVNIFAGINRCDWVAQGVVQAYKEVGLTIPVIVRLAGTNVEEGNRIIEDSGLPLITADTLADAAAKAVAARPRKAA